MTGYEVTMAPVPAYAGTGLPAAEVARILHGLDPAALQEAGRAHSALGRELDTMATQLTRESQTLAQHWSGAAARRAQAQFQRLHTQTTTLAAQATRTGSVLTWLGTQVVPAVRDPADAQQAQQYLTSLSAALIRANAALPPEIGGADSAQLASATPAPSSLGSLTPANPGPGNPAPGSPALGNLAASGPAPANPAPANPAPGNSAPGNPALGNLTASGPAASDPASANPTPGNLASLNSPDSHTQPESLTGPGNPTALSDPISPGAPADLSSSSAAPDAPSARPAPEAATDPTPSAAAPAPLIPSVTARPTPAEQPARPGRAGQDSGLSGNALPNQPAIDPTSQAALSAASPTPAGHHAPGALPLAGGASSPSDHERHRESWVPDDHNVWGLPDTCVPPLIEGA